MKKKDLFLIGILLVVGMIGFLHLKEFRDLPLQVSRYLKFPWMEKYMESIL